ncbi:hypothetical protein DL546_006865 [Coniochaeta pulveracea]|uniref:FAD-binding PCMH-type domain-containing protein n=1 Tax=Coniochaeta pulveracea TaxID=177199 RepID=A0A420Y6N8_9PEZI|nr:hypothetical protein DL546_006865 [Coniochaeta pulveracea]
MKLLVLPLFFLSTNGLVSSRTSSSNNKCKSFPGDRSWPSQREWDQFNATIHGRLIKTVPLGSPCHDPYYDAAACEALKTQWGFSPVHMASSSSVQDPIFANASCDPFTSRNTSCLLGNYVAYAVNVTGPDDIAATIKFADKNDIRLVIRNTGHDYVGRSTGAGALAVWTHNLKGTEVKDWSDPEYTGKAIKIGAGIQGYEAFEAASEAGLVLVTGECPTVGVAGGYTQSGGHSPLTGAYGLSAHNTLEFEVVTADGRLVRATSRQNSDLFWALSGSGSGNYGVVVSVTLRAHPDAITSGVSFDIGQPGLDYVAIINAWHAALPALLDAGYQATYGGNMALFSLVSLTGYNKTQSDITAALTPFVNAVAALGHTFQPNYTSFPSYHDHYSSYYGPLPVGKLSVAGEWLMGGRLLSRTSLSTFGPTLNATFQLGTTMIGQAMNTARFAPLADSKRAVLPQWKDTLVMGSFVFPYNFTAPFAEMQARQDFITQKVMPLVEKATPGAGAYINEADYQQPDWQETFYGANYHRLLDVKRKWDHKAM